MVADPCCRHARCFQLNVWLTIDEEELFEVEAVVQYCTF
jgi:hypothetical protein